MEILKKSFHNFIPRGINDSINVSLFEEENKLLLPPLFKVFIESFFFSKEKSLVIEQVYIEKFNYKEYLGYVEFLPNSELQLGNFFSPEEGLIVRNKLYQLNDDVHKKGYFPIGDDATGHYILMVGINDDNKDKIFVESSDKSFVIGERFTLISDNIFDFVRNLAFVVKEDIGSGVISHQLYRNWGEDFWRVHKKEV